MSADIQEAKRRLPLLELMRQLGYGAHVNTRGNAHCPFHDDQRPSFSIMEKTDGTWFWKCWAGCGQGDEIDFLAKARGLSNNEAIKEYLSTAGVATTLLKQPLQRSRRPENAPEQAGANKMPVQPRPLEKLLDAISEVLRRYVVFQFSEQATVIALWVVHTWVIEAFDYTAYLHVHSAEKRSGKSRLLDVLDLLVKKPWRTAGVSLAALFRKVERDKPTLLYDEIDTVFSNSKNDDTKDIQGFLNAGFERGAKFSRCVGQNTHLDVQDFEPFCPKALSGIGKVLPDTTADRCIPVELVRQSREEKVERFRKREAQAQVAGIRAELEAWSQQANVIDTLRDARPGLPDELTDRQQDICESLLATADLAGGEWPVKARPALVKLCAAEEDASIGVKLLVAIKSVFDDKRADKLPTKEILEALVGTEDDAPWALMFEDALKHEKLNSAASKLARLLKPYGVKPCKIRVAEETAKGYYRSFFEKVWERYLPPSSPPPLQEGTKGTNAQFTSENSCSHFPEQGVNVPTSQNTEGTQFCEGRTSNVPSVHTFPDGEGREPLEDENSPSGIVYPGGWLRYWPNAGKPAPNGFSTNPTCELCGGHRANPHWPYGSGDKPYWYVHYETGALRCDDCQGAEWEAQGFEIDDGYPFYYVKRRTGRSAYYDAVPAFYEGEPKLTPSERLAARDEAYRLKGEQMLERHERWLHTQTGRFGLLEANTEFEALRRQAHDRLISEAKSTFNAEPSKLARLPCVLTRERSSPPAPQKQGRSKGKQSSSN